MKITMGRGGRDILSKRALLNPEEGMTVLESPGSGTGYWTGAPSVLYDEKTTKFYLYYRIRKPRPIRGVECYIAQSKDGIKFSPIWGAKKEEFDSPSVERGCLIRTRDGSYRLYISLVDPVDNRWRIDVMEALHPEEFKVNERKRVLSPSFIPCEGVKDPYVLVVEEKYYMMVSYAPTPKEASAELRKKMHLTADVYNTGTTKSHTGLALSNDGINFEWWGDVLSPGKGWDAYASRISCVLCLPPVFIAFYDGSSTVKENYEEKTGLGISFDLMHYQKITREEPLFFSPHTSGSLRYMDCIIVDGEVYYYYEYATEDGSHEVRMNKVRLK